MLRQVLCPLLFVAFMALNFVQPLYSQQLNAGVMGTGLFQEIDQSGPEVLHGVFVVLKDRVDVGEQQVLTLRAGLSQEQRTIALLSALQTKAASTQPVLLDFIRGSGQAGPASVQQFWAVNAIYIQAKKGLIAALSQRPEVVWIERDEILEHSDAPVFEGPAMPVPNGREPGLDAIKAPALWALGYTGYGRKVLVVDSGQDPDHPALRNQFAYHNAPIGQVYLSTALPDFCDPHGTGVASAAVGMDAVTRDTLGAAFNAQWMGAPFSNLRNVETDEFCVYKGSVRDVVSALQWALNPDGQISTVNDIPDVINNSYGRTITNTAECSQVWPDLFRSLDAAGIAVVFSAGNNGPDPGSVGLQASISISDVVPFSVGAVGASNNIAGFSSRGPSQCTNLLNTALDVKPEVVAPGSGVRVASPGRVQYTTTSGTSFSAPYVSGALLLLKEAFPYLPGRELARALYNTAVDLGLTGEDNSYGNGLIDVFAAYQYLVGRGNQPIVPVRAKLDVQQLNTTSRLLNCGGSIFLETSFRNGGTEVLRSFDIVVRREFSQTPLFTTKWTGSLAPGETGKILLPEFSGSFGTYVLEVELRNPNGNQDERALNNQFKRRVTVSPQPLLPQISPVLSATCAGSRALITAKYEGDGTLRWYGQSDSGTAIAEGPQLYTGPLNRDTVFYAELRFNQKIGKADNSGGGSELSTSSTGGLVFSALANFTLKSVLVFAEVTGPRNIRLKRPDGSIQQRLINVPKIGANRLNLGFTIDPGENYVLDISVGRELYINTAGSSFPYLIPGVLRIDRSENANPQVYSFFYDWEIEYNNPCGRLPVRIATAPGPNAPKAAFTGPAMAVPLNTSGIAQVAFQNTSTAATQYLWNFGDGNSSNAANPTHQYTKAGKYVVSLSANASSGCSDVAIGQVEITPITSLRIPGLEEHRLRVFPNPLLEKVFVQLNLERPETVEVHLVDLLGRRLTAWDLGKGSDFNRELDLSGRPAGTYLLMVTGSTFQTTRKIVIQPY